MNEIVVRDQKQRIRALVKVDFRAELSNAIESLKNDIASVKSQIRNEVIFSNCGAIILALCNLEELINQPVRDVERIKNNFDALVSNFAVIANLVEFALHDQYADLLLLESIIRGIDIFNRQIGSFEEICPVLESQKNFIKAAAERITHDFISRLNWQISEIARNQFLNALASLGSPQWFSILASNFELENYKQRLISLQSGRKYLSNMT